MNKILLDETSCLDESTAEQIVARAAYINCECPRHLVALLHQLRNLEVYEKKCAEDSPEDRRTHEWLYNSIKNLDQMLSATIIQLARMEGMINDTNEIVDHPNKS